MDLSRWQDTAAPGQGGCSIPAPSSTGNPLPLQALLHWLVESWDPILGQTSPSHQLLLWGCSSLIHHFQMKALLCPSSPAFASKNNFCFFPKPNFQSLMSGP